MFTNVSNGQLEASPHNFFVSSVHLLIFQSIPLDQQFVLTYHQFTQLSP